ncbi:MAG: hypothetical protein FJW20_24345 [Acidimicrobiia bacterium]|nr:hypothetical protein [Acidimicrobiia bacterium]
MTTKPAGFPFWVLPLAVSAVIALTYVPSNFVGGFHDDGVYLVTAKALAEGKGYTIESLPEPIQQTKYPILFPALLSLVWSLWPNFPDNIPLLRLIPMAAAAAWGWALWRLVGVAWNRPAEARWLVPLVMSCPMVIYLAAIPLSETLFAFLCTCSILVLWKAGQSSEEAIRQPLLAAIVCAAAFHTRTMALSLLPCAVLAMPPWKRPQQFGLFGIVLLALCAPWWTWLHRNPASADPVVAFYTKANYSMWNSLSSQSTAQPMAILQHNAGRMTVGAATFWNLPRNSVTLLFCLAVTLLASAGLVKQLFRQEALGAAWALATISMILFWSWPPERFLAPVLPFVVLAVPHAVPSSWMRRLQKPARLFAILFIAWGLGMCIHYAVKTTKAGLPHGPLIEGDVTWQDHRQAYEWIRAKTPPAAVVSSNLDPNYWLYSGRKAIRAFSIDPVKLYYRPDELEGALGLPQNLVDLLKRWRVDYLAVEQSKIFREIEPFMGQIRALRETHPAFLTVAFESDNKLVTIYKVNWPGLSHGTESR